MKESNDNWLKQTLKNINAYFQLKNKKPVFAPAEVRLKIDLSNGITKNFLRLCNKTMIGLNRIHISRGKIFAGLSGLLLGYACSKTEETLLDLKANYSPAIKSALILHVLQSQEIKETLNRNLLQNVYTNPQVQYSLHELLDWKAIRPQMDNLFELSKENLLRALNDPAIIANLSTATGQAVTANKDVIGKATLDFLQSQHLQSIVGSEIASFFRSETFYLLLAREIMENVRNTLTSSQNRHNLYNFCKENFLNW